ncbi:MAG: nidogen-like domain-containing protein [Pseudomonadota bacterium]
MSVSGDNRAQRGLGGAAGLGEIAVPRGDDETYRVDARSVFESGFSFFGRSYAGNDLYVNTNGTISFGQPFTPYVTSSSANPGVDLLAPFWGDVDTRLDGEGAESGQIWIDLNAVGNVLTVTWENAGVYRRNAEDTNTFQAQLFDRGNGAFDVVYRYETIDWTIGTAENDAGARAGIATTDGQGADWITLGRDHTWLSRLPTSAGNAGLDGVWFYSIESAPQPEPDPPEPEPPAPEPPAPQPPPDPPTPPEPEPQGVKRFGTIGNDTLEGGNLDDELSGAAGNDVLRGKNGNDFLKGGDGADTINAEAGDDTIWGGTSEADLRDLVYAGSGDDSIDGGAGNDLVYGQDGDDVIIGGSGADNLQGQSGNDTISGGSLSDLVFGGDGVDYINGGFGFDRLNGGKGGDRFFHAGVAGHGSDWIQDYTRTQGDILVFGNANASLNDFQINFANTPNAGDPAISEAFVIYRPTGQIMWALIDGDAQPALFLQIGGDLFSLV